MNKWQENVTLHIIMIGRQLDLFGGPPKPPKNIVIEDEPEVQEPEIKAPEPPAPELETADAEPINSIESVVADAGIHVQMPAAEYEEPSFLPEEAPFTPDEVDEGFKLIEFAEDYTLEEAIAAELVADTISLDEFHQEEMNEAEPSFETGEVSSYDGIPELQESEPAWEEPSDEEPAVEESAVEEPDPNDSIMEEPSDEEPAGEEEPAIQEPDHEEPVADTSSEETPFIEEPVVEFLKAETEQERAPELLPEVPVSGPEIQESLVISMEEEPDWVTGDHPDTELSLAQRERLDEIPEESFDKLVSEAEQEEERHEPAPEVTVDSTEVDVHEGGEVGPLNIPPDQTLYSRQYYTMRETANMFNVNQSLLRFWENEFDILKPKKNRKGDRYFRPDDIKNLELIYHLLRVRKFTISGAKDYLKNKAKSLDTFVMVQRLEKLKLFLQELKTHA